MSPQKSSKSSTETHGAHAAPTKNPSYLYLLLLVFSYTPVVKLQTELER